jgi:hypothetical protein
MASGASATRAIRKRKTSSAIGEALSSPQRVKMAALPHSSTKMAVVACEASRE